MDSRDTEKLIKQLDPARTAPVPEADSLAGRRIRKAALAQTGSMRNRRRVVVGGAAAAFVVFAGTAAALLLSTGSSPNPVQSLCYAAPSLDSDAVGSNVNTTANVADCYRFWQDGTFANDGVVPALTACVLEGGGLAVLPGDSSLCASLGMADSAVTSEVDPVVQLQTRLRTLVPLGTCAPFDETVASMRNVIETTSLPGWEVVIRDQPTTDRPCASFSLEGDSMAVVVVPIPSPN